MIMVWPIEAINSWDNDLFSNTDSEKKVFYNYS